MFGWVLHFNRLGGRFGWTGELLIWLVQRLSWTFGQVRHLVGWVICLGVSFGWILHFGFVRNLVDLGSNGDFVRLGR